MSGDVMKKRMPRKNTPPSAATLRAIPSVDLKAAKVRRNPYAARVASEGIHIQIGRGRPLKGKERGPTIPRSVRFPAGVWEKLERRAKAQGLPLHAALRSAVLAWLEKDQ
jgi:hypothetical protein